MRVATVAMGIEAHRNVSALYTKQSGFDKGIRAKSCSDESTADFVGLTALNLCICDTVNDTRWNQRFSSVELGVNTAYTRAIHGQIDPFSEHQLRDVSDRITPMVRLGGSYIFSAYYNEMPARNIDISACIFRRAH